MNKYSISLVILTSLLLSACAIKSISTTKELCKINLHGHELEIKHSLGGAVSSDYLTIHFDGSLHKMWKIAGDCSINKVSAGDSLTVSFVDPVYFIDQREYLEGISVPLK